MDLKKILCAVALGACTLGAGSAKAEYYVKWAVSAEGEFSGYGGAMVHVTGGGYEGYLTLPGSDLAQYASSDAFADGKYAQGQLNVDSGSDYMFQIELYDASGDSILARSALTSMADVKDALGNPAISTPMNPQTGVWAVSTFSAVPEPTSGLLLLLGVAGLALKRKRS